MGVPPRLSDQQKFILAYLAEQDSPSWPTSRVSWAVAREFGGRVVDRQETMADADGGAALVGLIAKSLDKQEVLTPEHRASFSRAVSRVEERGLVGKVRRTVERESWDGDTKVVESRPSKRAARIGLTDDGEEVADELLTRTRDGRYSLSFETV